MARGWESKGVESQIEDRRDNWRSPGKGRRAAELLELEQKRAGLETSRRRVVRELETAHSDSHKTALKNALAFLDGELKKLQ